MFCSKCGNRIGDGEKFCANCGNSVESNITKNIFPNAKLKQIGENLNLNKKALAMLLIAIAVLALLIFGVRACSSNANLSGLSKVEENGISEKKATEIVSGYFKAFAKMDSSKMKKYLTADSDIGEHPSEELFDLLGIAGDLIPNEDIAKVYSSALELVKDIKAETEYVSGSFVVEGDEAVARYYVNIDCKVDKVLKLAGIDGYSETFECSVLLKKESGKWLIYDIETIY